jgi:hypothetical protein
MLKDLAAVWLCKDDGQKNHVGRAFLPAFSQRPRMVALHSPLSLKPRHPARLVPSDHEWSPYIPL